MNKTQYATQEQIQLLIDNNSEESIHLEFKSGEALDKTDQKKRDIAKDVSAFANSAGGTLIYGIEELNHKATSFKPVDGSVYTKEWLQQIIHSNISRHILGLEITPIRLDGDINRTVYVVNIPESTDAPHIASDKKFYRRYNFECVPMEEYEVRQLYFRTQKAQLRILDLMIDPAGASTSATKFNNLRFRLDFQVENVGRVTEQHYKLEIWMPELMKHELHAVTAVNVSLMRKELMHAVFAVPNSSPLFPGEKTTMASAIATIEKGTLFHLKETEVICKLYSSGDIQHYRSNLSEHLSYGGKTLSLDMFAS